MKALRRNGCIHLRLRRGGLLGALMVGLVGVLPASPASAANLVIVSVDTLGRSWVRAFDPRASPHATLDRLADRSLRFMRAYSTAPWTLPAHASLLTGLYPDRNGAYHPRTKIPPDAPRLAEALRATGYETLAFTDQGFVHPSYGFAKGFDLYDDASRDGFRPDLDLPRDGARSRVAGEALFDRAIAYLEARTAGDPPFFLFLHVYSVHDYFTVHPWAAAAVQRPPAGQVYLNCLLGLRVCPSTDWAALRALYAAEVEHLDLGLTRLLASLERTGLSEDTLFVLLSDHGEGFDPERGRIHHGGRLHEDQIRIPLLLRGPGVRARETQAPVSLVDVMPTVLDLLGVSVPSELDGRSLATVVRGAEEIDARPLYAMEYYHWWEAGRRRNAEEVRTRPLTLAVIDDDQWYIRTGENEELYDVVADPSQTRDRTATSDALERLRVIAEARTRPSAAPREHVLDEDLRRRLRKLGYVE